MAIKSISTKNTQSFSIPSANESSNKVPRNLFDLDASYFDQMHRMRHWQLAPQDHRRTLATARSSRIREPLGLNTNGYGAFRQLSKMSMTPVIINGLTDFPKSRMNQYHWSGQLNKRKELRKLNRCYKYRPGLIDQLKQKLQ